MDVLIPGGPTNANILRQLVEKKTSVGELGEISL